MTAQELIALIKKRRFIITNEMDLQAELQLLIASKDEKFRRSKHLDEDNIIDFLFQTGLGVEVKIKGGARAIYRQCVRYCDFDAVKSLLLITTKSVGLPTEINGKPVFVYNLNKAWL